MLKWVVTLVVAIFVLGIVAPHLARLIRFGQLPGDLKLQFRGRTYRFPIATTLIFSCAIWLVSRVI